MITFKLVRTCQIGRLCYEDYLNLCGSLNYQAEQYCRRRTVATGGKYNLTHIFST